MLGRMKRWQRALLAIVVALLAFGGVTWFALEGHDVAILRTSAADGTIRETHVWVAEDGGALVVEAATPQRAWLLEAAAQPEIELVHGGATARYRAVPEPGAAGHAKIRGLLRAKYGWADQWVALLQDTSTSVLVRLEPVAR
jgi:hypothetical protein